MNKPFNKRGTSLGNKLKGALTDLSVDIFGYEKMVTKNILGHTDRISQKLTIPRESLYIRIFQKNGVVRAFLYDRDRPLNAISIDELAYFFINPDTAGLLNVQSKIALSIKKYLKEFAEANRLHRESVRIQISVKDEKVNVRAFFNNDFIKEIPLDSLIKYFK